MSFKRSHNLSCPYRDLDMCFCACVSMFLFVKLRMCITGSSPLLHDTMFLVYVLFLLIGVPLSVCPSLYAYVFVFTV